MTVHFYTSHSLPHPICCKIILISIFIYFVLDLVVISKDEFASCSNDGRISLWKIDTNSFNTTSKLNFEDSDFVYSLAAKSDGSMMCSSGENTGE